MYVPPPWSPVAPLRPGRTVLLEASAGTGKTWQLASLVLRLVAEYQVPLSRILAITFTRAATAELRARVRRRLEEGREALATRVGGDPVLDHLITAPADVRATRTLALEAALANFDEAPISTIHAFAHQMLTRFAFESGQEADLSLIEDGDALLEARVDDALAQSFAALDGPSLEVLRALGWRRENLLAIARRMAGAVAPRLRPEAEGALTDEPLAPEARAQLTALLAEAEALRAQWLPDSPATESLRDAFTRKLLTRWQADYVEARPRAARALLEPPTFVHGVLQTGKPWSHLLPAALAAAWKGDPGVLQASAFWQASEALGAFVGRVRELLRSLRPLLAFAHRVRAEVRTELARRRALTHDAMLSLLAERIAATGPDGALARAIRGRFDVALVDEFQDTDAAQWQIIEAVFAHRSPGVGADGDVTGYVSSDATLAGREHLRDGRPGFIEKVLDGGYGMDTVGADGPHANHERDGALHGRNDGQRALFLIGDPKQAIYAFRGGDVHVYLQAAGRVDARHTMTTNFRSDAPLVEALNTLWGAAPRAFGHPGVAYVPVEARRETSRLPPGLSPLELRWFDSDTMARQLAVQLGRSAGDDALGGGAPRSFRGSHDANACAARLAAVEALRLARTPGFAPGDLAVLVPGHREAWLVKRELERVGLPAVRTASGNVFASEPARWLIAWLRAVAGGGRDRWARVVATTPLFGWTVERLAAALEADATDDGAQAGDAWADLCMQLAAWGDGFVKAGFVRSFEAACTAGGVMARVLGGLDGERHATDLRHLVELTHLRSIEGGAQAPSPLELAAWLADASPDREGGREGTRVESDESRAQRLETDARAVTIMTGHASKGLEFPVVLLPFAWRPDATEVRGEAFVWHDDAGEAVLDLRHGDDPERAEAVRRHLEETSEERMRLLYVALTRARHRTVAWMTVTGDGDLDDSAFGRLLIGDAAEARSEGDVRSRFAARLEALEAASEGRIGGRLERGDEALEPWIAPESGAATPLHATPWRGPEAFPNPRPRVSFTSLTSQTPEASRDDPLPSDPEVLGLLAPEAPAELGLAASGGPNVEATTATGPLDGLRGGKDIGVWVHGIFETLDFGALTGPLGEPLADVIARAAVRAGVAPSAGEAACLMAAFPTLVGAPLDSRVEGREASLPEGFCLGRLPRLDRLDELAFDLRMSGRHDGLRRAILTALAHRRGAGWDGAAWLEQVLAERGFALPPTGGALNGAIDLIFRAGGRYWIADYKTNQASPTAMGHPYGRAGLARLMGEAHYHLQALLYTLALHRLLRQRLGASYDYDRHVGGHLYLFLRGLGGPDSAREPDGGRRGVFEDRWPREVVEALDAQLSDGARGGSDA